MTTVYWNIFDPNSEASTSCLVLSHFDPEPVLPYIVKNRDRYKIGAVSYVTCPAFLDYYKNMYLVRSPIDIEFTYNSNNNTLNITPQEQKFYDKFVVHRGNFDVKKSPFLMSLSDRYIFVADEDCMIEQLPVTFHDDTVSSQIRLICGTFNINKWFRPVEFAFEFLDNDKPVVIKRGDPLYYLRFIPRNDEKVVLEKRPLTKDAQDAVLACVSLKEGLPKQPLKILYELAKRVKPKIVKKCPFNWR